MAFHSERLKGKEDKLFFEMFDTTGHHNFGAGYFSGFLSMGLEQVVSPRTF